MCDEPAGGELFDLVPQNVWSILHRLSCEYPHTAYIVGGCVRDGTLGIKPHDWDICTDATPNEVMEIFSDCRAIETGLKHGTVTIIMRGEQYEITTFRTDGKYTDGRHPDTVEFVSNVEVDLARRDFTINAMAFNDYDGLVDPYGGRFDLERRLIRCVGNPDDRFQEDGLRILRALRFASVYSFDIETETSAAIHRNAALLDRISAERICSELFKLLCGKNVLSVLMEYSDIICKIIPQMSACVGFNQNNLYHQYTVYEHIARSVAAYEGKDTVIKMALLLHDIGKPQCYFENDTGGHFYGHPAASAVVAEDVLNGLKVSNYTKECVLQLVKYHDETLLPTAKCARKWLSKYGADQVFRLIEVRKADIAGQREDAFAHRINEVEQFEKAVKDVIASWNCFKLRDLQINGRDLLSIGVPEGKQVGETLNHLFDAVMNDQIHNNRNDLLIEAKRYIEERRSNAWS